MQGMEDFFVPVGKDLIWSPSFIYLNCKLLFYLDILNEICKYIYNN